MYSVDFKIQGNKFLPVIFLRQTLWSFVGDWQFFYIQKLLLYNN